MVLQEINTSQKYEYLGRFKPPFSNTYFAKLRNLKTGVIETVSEVAKESNFIIAKKETQNEKN